MLRQLRVKRLRRLPEQVHLLLQRLEDRPGVHARAVGAGHGQRDELRRVHAVPRAKVEHLRGVVPPVHAERLADLVLEPRAARVELEVEDVAVVLERRQPPVHRAGDEEGALGKLGPQCRVLLVGVGDREDVGRSERRGEEDVLRGIVPCAESRTVDNGVTVGRLHRDCVELEILQWGCCRLFGITNSRELDFDQTIPHGVDDLRELDTLHGIPKVLCCNLAN